MSVHTTSAGDLVMVSTFKLVFFLDGLQNDVWLTQRPCLSEMVVMIPCMFAVCHAAHASVAGKPYVKNRPKCESIDHFRPWISDIGPARSGPRSRSHQEVDEEGGNRLAHMKLPRHRYLHERHELCHATGE